MQYRLAAALASILVLSPPISIPTYAADTGGSTVPDCGPGKVYDKKTKKCVTQKQGAVDDDSLYDTGRQLALGGNYREAVRVLSFAENKHDPRILNYLGYSYRKMGHMLEGIGYYQEALRIDPDMVLVREYLGEAHLQMNNVPAARAQLDEIEKRCGKTCEEYQDLAAGIAART